MARFVLFILAELIAAGGRTDRRKQEIEGHAGRLAAGLDWLVVRLCALIAAVLVLDVWLVNAEFYDGLTDEERYVIDYAVKVAVDAGRGISRIIEASDKGLPALAASMNVNALGAAELEEFRTASQPAVTALIAERFGEDGTVMLEAMLEAVKE